MATKVKKIPDGYTTLTPVLSLRDAASGIEFYKRAFGAEELFRMHRPDGKIMHAELRIGTSRVMLGEEAPEWDCHSPQSLGATPVQFYVYVEDVDAAFRKAIDAGAKQTMPVADMFWGDRLGAVVDPFGHRWSLATHKADLTPEQLEQGQRDWLAKTQAERTG
jgi:PhnB protein